MMIHFARSLVLLAASFLSAVLLSGGHIIEAAPPQQIAAGSISGTVFFDLNLNGLPDVGEGGADGTGVDGAYVHLQDANGVVVKTYLTSDRQGGAFSFSGLALGAYTLLEVDPAMFGSTTPNTVPVTLTSEAPTVVVNFGDVTLRTISGRIYEDRDANGAYNPGDVPLVGATVTVVDDLNANNRVDDGEGVIGTAITDSFGNYAVQNILPGPRLMIVQNPVGGVIGDPIPVLLSADPAGGVQAEDLPVYTISGRVYEDRDASNSYSPNDVPLADVTVSAIVDKDADGQVDADETVVGSAVSDQYGLYVIQYVQPGPHIMTLQNAVGGAIGDPIPVVVPADPGGGVGQSYDLGVMRPASLIGVIWHDVDGNELIDEGEAPLSDVRLSLLDAACGVPASGTNVIGTTTTDLEGRYTISGLSIGACYELRLDVTTLPSGWVSSADAAELVVQITTTVQALNVGYYNPLAVDPLRQAEWKKELRQIGQPRYTTDQLNGFIATAEASSEVFPETGYGIRDTLLKHPIREARGSALQEHAALWLNLASKRLFETTPVWLPELTNATTIRAARDEIEAALLKQPQTTAEYERVRKLARSINAGKGLGYGKQGTMQVSKATYRGSSVASKLRSGGEYVDMYDATLYLQSWSPGSLSSSTNVQNPQLRVKALAFYNGAILEVQQTLPNGRTVTLGTATPSAWDTNLNATYTFELRDLTSVGDLASAKLQLYTRRASSTTPSIGVLAANTDGDAKMDIKPGQAGAQSFVYGRSGEADYYIHKLTLRLSRESEAPNASLQVNIGEGINTGALAGSGVSIAPSQVTNNSGGSSFMTYEIVYGTPVGPLTAGRKYYLNFTNTSSNGKVYYIAYGDDDSYGGGTYYKQFDDDEKDAWFQIWGSTDPNATAPATGGTPHIKIDSTELVFGY